MISTEKMQPIRGSTWRFALDLTLTVVITVLAFILLRRHSALLISFIALIYGSMGLLWSTMNRRIASLEKKIRELQDGQPM
jgi:hypothetical protein